VRLLKLDNNIIQKVENEIAQINKLFDSGKPLLDLCKLKEPDFVEASAAALFLQSFYNGIEGILLLIFKGLGENIPNDLHWRKKLLEKSFETTEKRKNVFKNENKKLLTEYLSFRHFIRHSYGYQIKWERLRPLIIGIENFWGIIEKDIKIFLKSN
jgi:hypothetical protein